ncbi:Transcriptional regulator GlxA family, contains an amidase domain and an AraC-type DNA-binding HTH domain [Mucilaginibacter pineti]|uniref:Transcriptional regulator GlxA family, contains an amidase domain and an AraC-type DNA-binding HTH domain n=1 Tax=Mucilaginibacter pineti TaxID=1391627 RepID=A0A1G6U5D3_9SPHI|nr:helix-turn-helix domain-containing protein [Mucilaginibacter pineti]SDD35787.1 Transcriptional regulator GlxA family, contains an amidase domain and an AraC-type DNA-binding HTH domain [Mucilaginibacter pineti]
MDKKKIAIVVMSGNFLMDFAGPADVFGHANQLRDMYEVVLISPDGRTVNSAGGLQINSERLENLGSIDTLLIVGNDQESNYDEFYTWLAGAHNRIRRIGTIGVGAAIVEKAGLLLDSNYFHTRDGQLYTSGGVSSGIDLALAMVEEDCGRGVAAAIARKLIFFYLNRQAYQVQFGTLVDTSPIAVQLKEWLAEHLHESLDVGRLAEKMNMSPRNFTRVFTRQTGISPAKFIEKLRVEAARLRLDEIDEPLEQIALRCGLGGLVSMRRLFLRHLMVTPSDYRRFLKLQKYENCN